MMILNNPIKSNLTGTDNVLHAYENSSLSHQKVNQYGVAISIILVCWPNVLFLTLFVTEDFSVWSLMNYMLKRVELLMV